jgi:sterol desaturase/sphingolipid hydroxylase (fatty acid hydroxylase superfamily)
LGDAIFRLIAPGLLLVLFGFDHHVIFAVSSLTALVGTGSHLNLKISIPKPFVWLIVNPITHRIHHNKNEVAVNNGNISHLWDHIMGTYALYDDMPPDDYGLPPEEQISDAPTHIFFTTLT